LLLVPIAALIPRTLRRKILFLDLSDASFPNVLIGNPGEIGTGPPIKTSGVTILG